MDINNGVKKGDEKMKPAVKVILILLTIVVVIGIVKISSSEIYKFEAKSNPTLQSNNQVTEIEKIAVDTEVHQHISSNDTYFDKFIKKLNSISYFTGITILISFLFGALVVLLITRPFRKQKNANKRMSKTESMEIVQIKSNEEIGQLVKGLNQVVVTLEQTEQNRRIFYADMVRELRNSIIVEQNRFEEIISRMILPYQEELGAIRNELLKTTHSVMNLKEVALNINEHLTLQEQKTDFQSFLSRIIEEATMAKNSIKKGSNITDQTVRHMLQHTDN